MVAAVASAIRDALLDADSVFVGEVGLGGEMRPVRQLERRLAEAGRLGFQRAYLSSASEAPRGAGAGAVKLETVPHVGRLIDALFG